MDANKMNTLIATKLFGLKPQVDFGRWEEHAWKLDRDGKVDDYAWSDDRHAGPQCERCSYAYCDSCSEGPDEPCEIEVPDYTEGRNFLRVLDKLKLLFKITIDIDGSRAVCTLTNRGYHPIQTQNVSAKGDSMQKAVCLAAVQFLSSQLSHEDFLNKMNEMKK